MRYKCRQSVNKVIHMPKSEANPKSTLVSTRVTPDVRSIVLKQALADGLTISEWIRFLIIREIARRNTASKASGAP